MTRLAFSLPADFPSVPRFVTDATLPDLLEQLRSEAGRHGVPLAVSEIGRSRGGRPLYGLRLGDAPRSASITAGAHADEPVGPMTAFALALWCITTPAGRDLLRSFRFHLCPQVNPDGAEANRRWFADPPDPVTYLRHAVREQPGDDIEFGYPGPLGPALRPENEAVARFFTEQGPVAFHASLHGMAVAEGAWFLIGHHWINRTAPLRHRLAEAAAAEGLPLHDIDRHGDKGFFRIAPGFNTTPTSAGMRDHFLARGDQAAAARFRLNSMEFAPSLGGEPLVMVSELPLFLIGERAPSPGAYDPDATPPVSPTLYERFRARLPEAVAGLRLGEPAAAEDLIREFHVRAVPLAAQIRLQALMVVGALESLREAGE